MQKKDITSEKKKENKSNKNKVTLNRNTANETKFNNVCTIKAKFIHILA